MAQPILSVPSKIAIKNTERGFLRMTFGCVSIGFVDGNYNVNYPNIEKHLEWVGNEMFTPIQLDLIFSKIAKQVDCTVPRRAFVQVDWQLIGDDGKTEITSRQTALLKICKDLSVIKYDSVSSFYKAAEFELTPCLESMVSEAKDYASCPESNYSKSCHSPTCCYNEKTRYRFGGQWRVRNYLTNKKEVEKREITAVVINPWNLRG